MRQDPGSRRADLGPRTMFRRIPRSRFLGALFLLLPALTGCGDDATRPGEPEAIATRELFDEAGLAGVRRVNVEGVNGAIEISTGAVDRIAIEVSLEVRAQTEREATGIAGSVRIAVEQRGSVLEIRADYPEPPVDVLLVADWRVTIPFGMAVELATINGAVGVHGRVGELVADVRNGAIVLRGSAGPVRASTLNGAFDVDLEVLTGSGAFTSVNGAQRLEVASGNVPIEASTTNGEIYLGLTSAYSAILDAMCANGDVSSTLPLEEIEISTPTHLRGTLGSGGPAEITLRTVNGRIVIGPYAGS